MSKFTTLAISSALALALVSGSALAGSPDKNRPSRNLQKESPVAKQTKTAPTKTTPKTNTTTLDTDTVHFNKLLSSIDINSDGLITPEEWNKVNTRLGDSADKWNTGLTDSNHPQHVAMVRRFDSNNDGKLNKSEREAANREWQTTMLRMIAAFDKNKDGTFSQDERAQFFATNTNQKGKINRKQAQTQKNNPSRTTANRNQGTPNQTDRPRVNVDSDKE